MGKVAEIKTKQTEESVEQFIAGIADEQKRKDSMILLKLMEKITKEKCKLWGTSIIGFGNVRFKSPTSGREVDWFNVGFSPRKKNLTVYLVSSVNEHQAALKKLGKHKTGSGCLYVNKLQDIDLKILEGMIKIAAKK